MRSTANVIAVPEELVEQFERGNVLLFIGERILRDTEGQVVRDQLAFELATRAGLEHPEDHTFFDAAQLYEDKMGRQALVQYVRERLEALGDEPQPVHRLIAGLTGCKVMAITSLNRLLERAFEDAGRPLDVVIGNTDLAFEDDRKTQLYKLRGSIERPESLVLTEDDYEAFLDDQASISVVLQGYLARKTILFVGYDLTDPYFRRLHRKVTSALDVYTRRSYAFATTSSLSLSSWCKRHSIELVEISPQAFLQALVEQLSSRTRPAPPFAGAPVQSPDLTARPLPERPYKLLDYYDTRDTAVFFGRERETQTLSSLIHAHRLVVLYGASGTGKTSLMLAGVVPQLEQAEPPYAAIYVRVRGVGGPGGALRNALQRRLPQGELPQDGSMLASLSAAAKALGRTLVVFLDQFEEFFILCGPQSRQAFIAELAELYDARDIPVKIVFGLREDWLASMDEIRERVPEVYNANMRLLPLTRQQARQAITAPVEQLGMHYEPVLVERLLDDLAAEQGARTGESAIVMPPQLQLVCNALDERARVQRRTVITAADYDALGGAQGVLAGYLGDALQKHPEKERDVARSVLTALVTSQATRAWATLETIITSVAADEVTVKRVLDRLAGQRLVRRLDDSDAYELAHDILAASISGWIGEEDRRLKQAQELLGREMTDWHQDHSVLLSQGKYRRINAFRDRLRLTREETTFLLRAAILFGEDVSGWLERLDEPASQVDVLLEMLGNNAVQARLNAAHYLADFAQDGVAAALARTALEDPEPAVREMAAAGLAQIGGRAGPSLLLDAAFLTGSIQRERALYALALIQDTAPDRLAQVIGQVRFQISYTLARLRFRRDWPRIRRATIGGAVGGALGFALGMIPPVMLLAQDVLSSSVIGDILSFGLLLVILGSLAGAGMGLGIEAGGVLLRRRAHLGRILGGALCGGLSFFVVLFPFIRTDTGIGVGSCLFGALIGLGITVPAAPKPRHTLTLTGGALGGSLGIVVLGALGFVPFLFSSHAAVPLPVLLICGGLLGLSLSFCITSAETD